MQLKEQWKSLEPEKIREEVRKAETSPRNSTTMHTDHRKIFRRRPTRHTSHQSGTQGCGLFTAELFTWERITELLRQYQEMNSSFMVVSAQRKWLP